MKSFTIENETNNITIHASSAEAEAVLDSERFNTEEELSSLAANWPTSRLVDIWNSLPSVAPVKKFQTRAIAVERIWKAIRHLGEALPPEQPADEPVVETPLAAQIAAPEAEPVPSPEAEVPAPAAPQTAAAAPEEALATNDATPVTGAHLPAADERLLRLLARAFEGLTPEQAEEKWIALRNALATLKPEADKVAKTGAPRDGSKTSQVIAMLKREGGTTLEEIMAAMEWQQHTTRAMLSAGGSLAKKHGLVIVSVKVGDKRVYSIKS